MKRPPIRPTPDELASFLDYCQETGILRWKFRKGLVNPYFNTRFAGKMAGSIDGPYLKINFGGSLYYAQRVIWKIMTGRDPIDYVDHIDGNSRNNAWVNLREVSHDQNMWNSKSRSTNTSGYRGVSFIKWHGKWRAAICAGGKKQHLGYFKTAELAHAAFKDATFKMRDEYAKVA